MEQLIKREEVYKKMIAEIIDREKMPADEVEELVNCFKIVVSDCENGQIPNTLNPHQQNYQALDNGKNFESQRISNDIN